MGVSYLTSQAEKNVKQNVKMEGSGRGGIGASRPPPRAHQGTSVNLCGGPVHMTSVLMPHTRTNNSIAHAK